MTSAQVTDMQVTSNSLFQDYSHLDNDDQMKGTNHLLCTVQAQIQIGFQHNFMDLVRFLSFPKN